MPLAHAHRHGAGNWTKRQRREFANDFDNLVVVSDKTNHGNQIKRPMNNGCRLEKPIGVSMESGGSTLSINTN
ncbi:hypothetical protein [Nitrosomonas communis]|uniref:hypothetical protein n=1 Tax=Nitrosomonas communis TaxID=44574 RepID=UPI000944371A